MIDAPLGLAFTAGMFAVLNPCGFAMLPAYLSFFLGNDDTATDSSSAIRRALSVSLAVCAGFAALFAVIGYFVRAVTAQVLEYSPWVSVAIGAVLMGMGVALAAGRDPTFRIPRLDRGGRSGSARSMTLYGVSYGVVSLGCTLPTFLVYVAGTLTRENLASGAAVYAAYVLGFTSLLTALTLALALAKTSLLHGLRRVLPFVQRLSGVLLVLAGAYVCYYGWYELYRFGEPDPIIERVTGFSFDLQGTLVDLGGRGFGLTLLVVVLAASAWALLRTRQGRTGASSTRNDDR